MLGLGARMVAKPSIRAANRRRLEEGLDGCAVVEGVRPDSRLGLPHLTSHRLSGCLLDLTSHCPSGLLAISH